MGIRNKVADYNLADPMPANPAITMRLAATPNRLDDLPTGRQEMLIN